MFETRRLNHKSKVIISAALTGAVTTKENNPNLPTQPAEIVKSAIACYEAGAAVAHIHVRDDEDKASMRFDMLIGTRGISKLESCIFLLLEVRKIEVNKFYKFPRNAAFV